MNYKHQQFKDDLAVTIWFIPLVACMASIVAAYLMLYLDQSNYLSALKTILTSIVSTQQFSNTVLIITSTTITIATVTFSITILTLSMASNQLGPRLLPNFMKQNITQFVLAILIGTFVYTIVIQSTPYSQIYNEIPILSLWLSLLLCLVSVFSFVYFIHYSAYVIQIDNALEYLAKQLREAIKRMSQNEQTNKKLLNKIITEREINDFHFNDAHKHQTVTAKKDGYIQAIDYQEILKLTEKNDLIIHISVMPGDFVFSDAEVCKCISKNLISKKVLNLILDCFYIGKRRTSVQDIEFAFEELSEIALKALSPGINNPYTAIHCFDRITAGLAEIAKQSLPVATLYDSNQSPRIIRKTITYGSIVKVSISRFRQQAKLDVAVTLHLLKMLKILLRLDLPLQLENELYNQAKIIYEDTMKLEINDKDKNDIKTTFDELNQPN